MTDQPVITQKSQIELADDSDQWNRYLDDHAGSNFYQKYEWKKINERNFGHKAFYLTLKRDSKIEGIFPVVSVKSMVFGHILSSMPFVNFGGICANSDNTKHELLSEAGKIVRQLDADYLEIRSLDSISESIPSSLNKISMTLVLSHNYEEIWANFKSKHRTNIRRVYKHGVSIKQGHIELLDDFYQVLSKSWKRLGTPIYRKKYFCDILESFGQDTKIFVAYYQGKPIATAFNGHFKQTVEGMWAGALAEYRNLQPNYALYWEMIKDACENGFVEYHLGRSSIDSGAESFKRKWNAQSKQLFTQYLLNKRTDTPQLNVNNPKFNLAIKIWSKLPLGVTTTLGPFISKSIP